VARFAAFRGTLSSLRTGRQLTISVPVAGSNPVSTVEGWRPSSEMHSFANAGSTTARNGGMRADHLRMVGMALSSCIPPGSSTPTTQTRTTFADHKRAAIRLTSRKATTACLAGARDLGYADASSGPHELIKQTPRATSTVVDSLANARYRID